MKKQTIWIIIGCAISGAILYPIQRRRRMKEFNELTLDEKFAVRDEVKRLIDEMEAKC